MHSVSETTQAELRSGRVQAPARRSRRAARRAARAAGAEPLGALLLRVLRQLLFARGCRGVEYCCTVQHIVEMGPMTVLTL